MTDYLYKVMIAISNYGLKMSNAPAYNQMKEIYGDKVTLLEDQEWVQEDWDWIIGLCEMANE